MRINLGLGIGSSMYALDHVDPNTSILAFCKLRIYLNQVVALTYRWSLTVACFDRFALSSINARLRNSARVRVARSVVGMLVVIWLILPVHTLIFYNLRAGACGILYSTAAALYHSIFTTMVSCVLPASIMFTCALLIRRNLTLERQRHQPTANLQRGARNEVEHSDRTEDQQVLIMLFSQVIVYIISVTPLMAFSIYTSVTFNISNKPIERFTGFTAEAMIYLYTMSSRTFRKELISLLRSALACRRLINIQRVELITNDITLRRNAGNLSTAIQVSQSHVPDRVVLRQVNIKVM
jgi:hypothetical protein